ncbi:MAG: tol-pal system protein YbgF [Alphaproteobacteria bacterium CG_4_10_14_0_2_um_filter_63_37]|nr:MAG: tol-pal system protein YbgF [Proteobacteria bacterium CG1_02_64_396]PJA25829.1 MAG: tol-pal system protein YbgF [Alphaproteobacteria bacterium CG_4_10_14_0_2_um_filter_63_37]
MLGRISHHLLLLAACACALTGCVTADDLLAVQAQVDENRDRVSALERRLEAVEARFTQAQKELGIQQKGMVSRIGEVEEIRSSLAFVQGQVDTVMHRQDGVDQGAKRLRADVDLRLQDIETALDRLQKQVERAVNQPTPPVAASSGATTTAGSQKAPKDLYTDAYLLLKAGEFEHAIAAFTKFLEIHPDTEFSDNAQYWLGESYYALGRYDRAAVEFTRSIQKYPKGKKLAASTLKLGYSYQALGQTDDARAAYNKVVGDFPGTPEAAKAADKLKEIDAATSH